MAIVVEDGTIVTGANSYVTTAALTTYATARGVTLTSGAETLLIQAMDYIESLDYKGVRIDRDQPLKFPRAGIMVDGFELVYTTIPDYLKNGLMHTAMAIDAGNGPLLDLPRATKREKVGEIEVEYSDSSSSVIIVRKIMAMLHPLLASGGYGGNNFTVSKA